MIPARPASTATANSPETARDRTAPSRQGLALAAWIVVCFVAAGIGGLLTSQSVGTWYRTIAKPNWTPPDGVFGPVWTTLYLMMAIAAWLVWRRIGRVQLAGPHGWFFVQLALNVVWSGLFFTLRSPGLAVIEIALLWLAIGATIRAFAQHSRRAAWLLVPYWAWSTFAAALNFTIWRLNAG